MMEIFLGIIALSLGFFLVYCFFIARLYKGGRNFLCHKIYWHSSPDFEISGFDGCSIGAKCKWCGYEGMIDSQGNLF